MNLSSLVRRTGKVLSSNSSPILAAFGVSGVLATAYLAARASFKASRIIQVEQHREDLAEKGHPLDTKEKAKLVWKEYIPAAVSGTVTISCIIFGERIGARRTAAAYSLLTVSEKAFVEYKDKVVEQLGVNKEQKIRDEIAQDRVTMTSGQGIVIVGTGNVLCYEVHTGRYFNSDMETLRKAQNTINAKIISEMEATLDDFYHLVKLDRTSYSSDIGWNSDKLMELEFSTVLAKDGRPCLSFEYNYVRPLFFR